MRYTNLQTSFVKFCTDLIAEINVAEPTMNLDYFDFDTYSQDSAFPDENILGLEGFSYVVDNKMFILTTLITISTKNDDTNLTNHRKIIAYAMEKCYPHEIFDYVRDADGTKLGLMTIMDGTSLAPMDNQTNRSSQSIAITVTCNNTLGNKLLDE